MVAYKNFFQKSPLTAKSPPGKTSEHFLNQSLLDAKALDLVTGGFSDLSLFSGRFFAVLCVQSVDR